MKAFYAIFAIKGFVFQLNTDIILKSQCHLYNKINPLTSGLTFNICKNGYKYPLRSFFNTHIVTGHKALLMYVPRKYQYAEIRK